MYLKNLPKTTYLVFLLWLSTNSISGQGLKIAGQLNGNPEQILLSNLNVLGSAQNASKLFSLTLTNELTVTSQITLEFTLSVNSSELISTITRPFNLLPQSSRTIDNTNLLNRSSIKDIQVDSYRFNFEEAEFIQESILQRGKLPNGIYTIIVNLNRIQNNAQVRVGSYSEQIVIANATSVDLIVPGIPVDGGDLPTIYTQFPRFSWSSTANRFEVTVCEVLQTNNSPEDVMQNEPRFRKVFTRGRDFNGSPSFIYPSINALPLLAGKSYYWQIKAISSSPSGDILMPSEIWGFSISKLDEFELKFQATNVLNILKVILQGTPHEDFDFEDGALKGFRPTGKISINGRQVDLGELINLSTKVKTENKKVISATIQ